jgi:HPt (histidine-containing phosphotransfer) domain-containing protein
MNQLEQGLARGDHETVQRATHTLRPSSTSIGALALANVLEKMEQLLMQNNLVAAQELHCQVKHQYALAAVELQKLLN